MKQNENFVVYEKALFMQNLNKKLQLAEEQIEEGKVRDAKIALSELRSKYYKK